MPRKKTEEEANTHTEHCKIESLSKTDLLVMRYIQCHKKIVKSVMAEKLGISLPTINTSLVKLEEERLLLDDKYTINANFATLWGISICSDHCRIVALDFSFTVLGIDKILPVFEGVPNVREEKGEIIFDRPETYDSLVRKVGNIIDAILSCNVGQHLFSIGITFPTAVNNGRVLNSVHCPNYRGFSIDEYSGSAWFQKKKIDNISIVIENDAKGAALASYQDLTTGGEESQFMANLYMDSGLGLGVIINGEIFYGAENSAGEIGYIHPMPLGNEFDGDLENKGGHLSAIMDRCFREAEASEEVSQDMAKLVRYAISVIQNLFSFDTIVLSGRFDKHFARMKDALAPTRYAYDNMSYYALRQSNYGMNISAVGGAISAYYKWIEKI